MILRQQNDLKITFNSVVLDSSGWLLYRIAYGYVGFQFCCFRFFNQLKYTSNQIKERSFNSVVLDSGISVIIATNWRWKAFQFCCFRFADVKREGDKITAIASFQFCCFRFVFSSGVQMEVPEWRVAFNSVVLDSTGATRICPR